MNYTNKLVFSFFKILFTNNLKFENVVGIDPPRGVLMYGPPGTGKTMMAKAVANATTASFINVVGSEFVQKYLGIKK